MSSLSSLDLSTRRSHYSLTPSPHPPSHLTHLIQSAIRSSPSAFNSQSSRCVLLFGAQHVRYWGEIIPRVLREKLGSEGVQKAQGRLQGFEGAGGTVLFFEDWSVVDAMKERSPAYEAGFEPWSLHSSGMAQLSVWLALSAEGLGANLQHYAQLWAGDAVKKEYGLPEGWRGMAECVFGAIDPASSPKEKTYIDDAERFRVFGADGVDGDA